MNILYAGYTYDKSPAQRAEDKFRAAFFELKHRDAARARYIVSLAQFQDWYNDCDWEELRKMVCLELEALDANDALPHDGESPFGPTIDRLADERRPETAAAITYFFGKENSND